MILLNEISRFDLSGAVCKCGSPFLVLTWIMLGAQALLAMDSTNAIHLLPGMDVADLVRNAPGGTTFLFSPGTYRMQSIVPKDEDSFIGQGQAILNGSAILDLQPDGGLWSAVESLSPAGPLALR